MAFQVESKAAAFFNIFNANIDALVETNDATPPFSYAGDSPTNFLISADQRLRVRVKWDVAGLIPAISKLDYTVTLYANHQAVDSTTVTGGPLNPNTSANYNGQVVFNPAALGTGIYTLSVAITVKVNGVGGFNLPVAGFEDLGNIQVYPA